MSFIVDFDLKTVAVCAPQFHLELAQVSAVTPLEPRSGLSRPQADSLFCCIVHVHEHHGSQCGSECGEIVGPSDRLAAMLCHVPGYAWLRDTGCGNEVRPPQAVMRGLGLSLRQLHGSPRWDWHVNTRFRGVVAGPNPNIGLLYSACLEYLDSSTPLGGLHGACQDFVLYCQQHTPQPQPQPPGVAVPQPQPQPPMAAVPQPQPQLPLGAVPQASPDHKAYKTEHKLRQPRLNIFDTEQFRVHVRCGAVDVLESDLGCLKVTNSLSLFVLPFLGRLFVAICPFCVYVCHFCECIICLCKVC